MSIQTEITRINSARDTIRTKLVALGLAESTAKLDVLATAVNSIDNNGGVTVEVKEGETYTIPKGYHNGSGTVAGVAGGGNYSLQSKTVTPTKSQQSVTPDAGKYGLSDVTVEAIPEAYQDVSSVDAVAADVLANKKIVLPDGTLVAGTMPNNGAVSQVLDIDTPSYTLPKGYHNGAGNVSISPEAKTATPTESEQNVTPTVGKVLSKVTVKPIPKNYIATDDATAGAGHILDGMIAFGYDSVNEKAIKIEGTMPNNGAITKVLDATTNNKQYTVPAGYHNGSGKVSIVLEEKSVTPTKSAQNVTPSAGKVMSKVVVAAIPAAYQDVTGVTATEDDVLAGKKIVSKTGAVINGAMPNNGNIAGEIDGLTVMSYSIPAGYTAGGTVTLTSDIETMLAAI